MDTFSFLLPPFIASLILTGIRLPGRPWRVERGVIFVDLSLAQIAALETTIAVLYGIEPHSGTAYSSTWRSLLSAPPCFDHPRPPGADSAEAMIGICYAVASAGDSAAMSKSAEQTEHQEMLVGHILTVSLV
jgi:zinc/manganese transport system permease protein